MPFDVRADFVRVTGDTVLVPITIQIKNRDITFQNKDGVQRGTVNIFGRVTTLTGKIAQTFEDTVQVDVPAELLPKTAENSSVYWKALPLRPGHYRFDIVVKDVNGDRVGNWSSGCWSRVPRRSTVELVVDRGRSDGSGGHKERRYGKLRDRHDESASACRIGGRQADRLQAQPEDEFLDAGVQPGRG